MVDKKNNQTNQEVKTEKKEKEVVVVHTPEQTISDRYYEDYITIAMKRSKALDKVKEIALQSTKNNDWICQKDSPYLMESGAGKIRLRFGLKVWDVQTNDTPIYLTDENGQYYYFKTTGKVGFNEQEYIDAIGTCSSRDKFFAKSGDNLIELKDVDMTNICKKSYTNFFVNGVTRFVGIRNLTWEELRTHGIDKAKIVTVEYKSGKKSSKWEGNHKSLAKRIGDFILADCDGDKKLASQKLKELTSFKKGDKLIPGKTHIKNLSGIQIEILFKKLQDKIRKFENAGKDLSESQKQQIREGKATPKK